MARTPAKSGSSVLVCDDNLDAADSLSLMLQIAGFDVCRTYTGREALSVAEAQKPKVALLDIGLPDIDGYEVAKSIRARPWGSHIRIIAISGYGTADDKQKAFDAGFDYHFIKPVPPNELLNLLEALRSKRR